MDITLKKYPTLRSILWATIMVGCAAAIGGLAWWAWRGLLVVSNQKEVVCITLLLDGLGAALCIAGAMHLLDVPRQRLEAHWMVVYGLEIPRRVLLLAQLAATGLALYMGAVLLAATKMPMPK